MMSGRGGAGLAAPLGVLSVVALLAGCGGGTSEPAAETPTAQATSAVISPATVTVDVPGFTLGLPEGMSAKTAGLHTGEVTELSGAVHGEGDPIDLVLVWQEGQRSPDAALERALTEVEGRGVQVTRGDGVTLDAAADLDPVAQRVTLASTTGTVEGLAVVWTCPTPDRTFSMTVHGGDEEEQVAVAQAVLTSFYCTG
jgi:hypothetical protein